MTTQLKATYYDKILYQKFHPLYTIFQLIQLAAIIFYGRRYCKGTERVIALPISLFLPQVLFPLEAVLLILDRLVDFYYHSEPGYQEVSVITSNLALIPFSILIAKYASFLPRYNVSIILLY